MFYSNRMVVHFSLFNVASQLATQDSECGGDFQHLQSSDFQCLIVCLLSFQHQVAKISIKVVFALPLRRTGLHLRIDTSPQNTRNTAASDEQSVLNADSTWPPSKRLKSKSGGSSFGEWSPNLLCGV
jgi:hypothetical protein